MLAVENYVGEPSFILYLASKVSIASESLVVRYF